MPEPISGNNNQKHSWRDISVWVLGTIVIATILGYQAFQVRTLTMMVETIVTERITLARMDERLQRLEADVRYLVERDRERAQSTFPRPRQ